MTAIDVMAAYATGLYRYGRPRMNAPDRRQPDRVRRRPRPLVDPVPERAAGDRAVAGERVDHPRVRRDRRHAAEELRADDEEQDEDAARLADGVDPDLGRRDARGRRQRVLVAVDERPVRRREDLVGRDPDVHRHQQDEPEDHRDRRPRTRCRAVRRCRRRGSPPTCAPRRRSRSACTARSAGR